MATGGMSGHPPIPDRNQYCPGCTIAVAPHGLLARYPSKDHDTTEMTCRQGVIAKGSSKTALKTAPTLPSAQLPAPVVPRPPAMHPVQQHPAPPERSCDAQKPARSPYHGQWWNTKHSSPNLTTSLPWLHNTSGPTWKDFGRSTHITTPQQMVQHKSIILLCI